MSAVLVVVVLFLVLETMVMKEWKKGNDARLDDVGWSCLAGLEELVERG